VPRDRTSGLEVEALADLLEVGLLGEVGDADVDAGTERGAQVGGTERQVAELGVVGERQLLLQGRQPLQWNRTLSDTKPKDLVNDL